MKSHRTTLILLVLFFGGLLTVWGLDFAGVLTQDQRRLRADRVLPDLVNTPAESIVKVTIDRPAGPLAFERRGRGPGRWQMVEPYDVAAEPTRLETLVRNLEDLRRSPDAGTLTGSGAGFGLDPPAATVRLFGGVGTGAGSSAGTLPVAMLEIGKAVRGNRYVRPAGGAGIEVVDARLLGAVDLAAAEWRQPVVMDVPSFQVNSVAITRRDPPGLPGPGRTGETPPAVPGAGADSEAKAKTDVHGDAPPRVIRAERSRSGRWRLTAPVAAPAVGPKIESLLAALASLRVLDGAKGYIADNVQDFAPFGLSLPAIRIELTTTRDEGEPMVLEIGKPVPDQPDRVYVRQGGQDDVVIVSAKALTEIPESATAVRSQQVAEIDPAAVTQFQIRTRSDRFELVRQATGWELTSPRREPADRPAVESFLGHIQNLQSSAFLEPGNVPDPQLDLPVMTIQIDQARVGQTGGGAGAGAGPGAAAAPALTLRLGRHDIARKTIYGRLEDDTVILALPDLLLNVLPKNPNAFRDRTLLTENPAGIRKLTIRRRGGPAVVVEPDASGAPNRWRMRAPVDAPADAPTVTQVLAGLAHLRAEDFPTVPTGAGARPETGTGPGLDPPAIEIAWESDRAHRLRIGSPVPRTTLFFANLDDRSLVFTLDAATVRMFEAEFRDHRIWTFPAAQAERVLLRWPNRTVGLRRRRPAPPQGQVEWVTEPGNQADGIDLSRIGALVASLGQLQTTRYFQYEGPFPAASGVPWPRLIVEVQLASGGPGFILRIGSTTYDGQVCAAAGTADLGPGFFLPAPPWDDLIRSGERYPAIPDDPFAPVP